MSYCSRRLRRSPPQRPLRTAGIRPAIAAGVARAGADHAAAAAGALDCVFPAVEERGLARRRRFGGRRIADGLAPLERAVRLRQARAHLGREDADLLLLVRSEKALPHPAEHVVDD